MPDDPVTAPPNPAIPQEAVPELYRIRDVADIRPARGLQISQEVSLMGVPLIASSWWTLLLGLYGYILPFVLYASWVAIAMWDLIRREADSIPDRARWMGIVLVVPFVGPLLYFAFGRSTIPAQLRLMLTAGGVAAYLVFLALGARRSEAESVLELDPHPLEGLALRLRLDDGDVPDLAGGLHVRAAVRLLVDPLDVDDSDRVDGSRGSGSPSCGSGPGRRAPRRAEGRSRAPAGSC